MMAPEEHLALAQKSNPHVQYALNRRKNAIGARLSKADRWQTVAALTIYGWLPMERELLIDGKPAIDDYPEEVTP